MKNILVIDDDIQCNQMICSLLEGSGYQARAAFNGAEGLGMFRKERPDLVITDLYMPEKEGLETIIELRQMDTLVPILAISGGLPHMSISEMFNMAEDFGADAAMPKPFDLEIFLHTIKRLLKE